MEMTFDQYISNPMGIKNSVFSGREMYRTLYKEKLDKILLRESGKVKYTLYKSKNAYYVHFKIPSEPIKDFYYDTVIELYTDKSLGTTRSLKNHYVKFYSNDPSFVFTFAHAMKSNDMFIKDLEPKMSKRALKEKAKERNPKDEVGYVKSIFFAYLLMKQYGLFEKVVFDSYAEKYDKKILLSNIIDADEKVQARIDAEENLAKENKKSKERKPSPRPPINDDMLSNNTKTAKGISTVKTVGKSKTTKTTKRIKSK